MNASTKTRRFQKAKSRNLHCPKILFVREMGQHQRQ